MELWAIFIMISLPDGGSFGSQMIQTFSSYEACSIALEELARDRNGILDSGTVIFDAMANNGQSFSWKASCHDMLGDGSPLADL